MANSPAWYDASIKTSNDTLAALLNGGLLSIYTGAQPALNVGLTGTLLVSLTFASPAFAASTASGGLVTATANAITSGTAGNTGTAGYFAVVKSDAVTVVATGSVGTSGADLNMSTLNIVSGAVVTCSAFAITQAQQ